MNDEEERKIVLYYGNCDWSNKLDWEEMQTSAQMKDWG